MKPKTLRRNYGKRYAIDHDPLRKPAWRYERAQQIIDHPGKRPTRKDDLLVHDAVKFYRKKIRMESTGKDISTEHNQLARYWGPLYMADRLFNSDREGRSRWLLEARILSRQSDEAIVETSPIDAETVRVYEALFFHVRDRLDARDWITSEIITPVFQIGDRPWQPELMAKFFGYFGGPVVLESIVHGIDTLGVTPKTPLEVNSFLDDTFKRHIRTQSVTLMAAYQPSRYDLRDLLGTYVSLLSMQAKELATQGEENVFTQAIEVLRQVTPLALGDDVYLEQNRQKAYTNRAIEPRANEAFALNSGTVPSGLLPYNDPNWSPPVKEEMTVDAKPQTTKPTRGDATKKGG